MTDNTFSPEPVDPGGAEVEDEDLEFDDGDETPRALAGVYEPVDSEWPDGTSPYDDLAQLQDPDATAEAPDDDPGEDGPLTDPDEFSGQFQARFGSNIRTGSAAVAWARARRSWSPTGMCLVFSRSAFNVGSYYGSAAAAWRSAVHKHYGTPPPGVPVFWTGGSHGYGHVAVSLGGGLVRTTDWPRAHVVSTARISDIHRAWGHTYAGWTEDVNRVRIYQPGGGRPTVDASKTAYAVHHSSKYSQGKLLKHAVASEVGRGDMTLSSTALGAGFRTQYQLVQRKFLAAHGSKVTKADADGIPGVSSLRWLGSRHGFDVVV